jgi:hypothetical protein
MEYRMMDMKHRAKARRWRTLLALAAATLILASLAQTAWAEDWSAYKRAGLEDILAQPRPTGPALDAVPGSPKVRLQVKVMSRPAACDPERLRQCLCDAGLPKADAAKLPLGKCLRVRGPQGGETTVFLRASLADRLLNEIPLGALLDLFCEHVYQSRSGPGLLANDLKVIERD